MGTYFHMNLISTTKHIFKVEPIEYLGKYMTICLILSCEKQSICDKIAFLYFTSICFKENYSLNSRESISTALLLNRTLLLMDFGTLSRFKNAPPFQGPYFETVMAKNKDFEWEIIIGNLSN